MTASDQFWMLGMIGLLMIPASPIARIIQAGVMFFFAVVLYK